MSDFQIDIKGLAETQRKLYRFSDKLGDRVTLLALRSGAKLMLKRTRALAPKKTGRLRRAIRVKNSKIHRRRRNGKVGVYLTIDPGKDRNDPKGAWYGQFVERGYNKGSTAITGSQAVRLGIKGKFFIQRGYLFTRHAALRLIIKNIETGGKQLAKKL